MNRKGQAAMEFLMTYGWAILAAVIAIGVLAYFGVFTPGKYTTGTAIVNPPFYANAYNVKPAGVSFEFKNNGGDTFNITQVNITGATVAGTIYTCTANSYTGAAGVVEPGKTFTMTSPVTCNFAAGDLGKAFKGDIVITYYKAGSSLEMQSTGTIADKIA